MYKDADQTALVAGSPCFQPRGPHSPVIGSEDCLFLNIFTSYLPNPVDDAKPNLRPVIFFIYGGAFLAGEGSESVWDGGNLAFRGDIVYITMNYRLGIFGFLALDDGITRGNYAIRDQILALDWVRANIANFGGDPDRITIMGQSSGAISATTLLGSPKAIGKYTAAMA
jgi:carboxylesterase type B